MMEMIDCWAPGVLDTPRRGARMALGCEHDRPRGAQEHACGGHGLGIIRFAVLRNLLSIVLGVASGAVLALDRPVVEARMITHTRVALLVVLLVFAMALSAALGAQRRMGIVLLVVLSVVWLIVDQLFEGPDLLRVSHAHGLVAADLVGLAGLGVAAGLALADWRRRR